MNFSGTVAVIGKNSETVSRIITEALKKAECSFDEINVVWGKLSEMSFPDNINIAVLCLPDFQEYGSLTDISNLKSLIIPADRKPLLCDSLKSLSVFTYAEESNYADFIAKNVTDREDISHFELLAPDNIGRIYFDRKKYPNPSDVLASASTMLSLGTEFRKVISAFAREK